MNNEELIPKTKTCFYRLKCPACGNEQNVFSAATTKPKCLACNAVLAKTSASKIKSKTKIVKELR